MKVLALNPYDGGSHQQFLDQWIAHSEHRFTKLSLPARHFKWRIRQAAVGFAAQVEELVRAGASFDVLWTTSLLDAAELRGLLPKKLRSTPLVVYFHENQFEYPVRVTDARDVHFGLINWVSALAADQVWFNSDFNRRTYLRGIETLLKKMPDRRELQTLPTIEQRSVVEPPGAVLDSHPAEKPAGPLHILWVGRWEHDKRPDLFFAALRRLKQRAVPFRLSLLGQSFRAWPEEFETAKREFEDELEHFGYQPERERYWQILRQCDVAVSTADHEFFGLALLEAASAGCVPVVPARVVYPELYPEACLYSGEADTLTEKLAQLGRHKQGGTWPELRRSLDHPPRRSLSALVARCQMKRRARELDGALARIAVP